MRLPSIAQLVVGVNCLLSCPFFFGLSLQICRSNEHSTGRWVEQNVTSKDYYCCGYDNLDHRHNIEKCGGISLTGMTEHWGAFVPQSGGHACVCDRRDGRVTVNRRERYVWVPTNCLLLTWNASQFCHLLGNRTILFIGDSTMQQSAHAMMNMIRTGGGRCSSSIGVTRSRLYLFSDLASIIVRMNPNIVVLNHGAHAADDGDVLVILNNIKTQLRSPDLNGRNLTYVWRSNHPGHVNCDNFTSPDRFVMYPPHIDWYHYSLFPHWDDLARNFTQELDFRYIDLSPLYTRNDAHPGSGDCLHFCMPGPIDLISQLFLQRLYWQEI